MDIRVETICDGGFGGSAHVAIQLRNCFPGLGGRIITKQDLQVAYRLPRSISYHNETSCDRTFNHKNPQAISALNVFLRHTVIKKLDDLFFRMGVYNYAHVPRPIGSTNKGGYLYEWVFGTEGFVTSYIDDETFMSIPVTVDDWNVVSGAFNQAGIAIFHDIADAEDGRWTKNIIVEEPELPLIPEHISKMWKRIDFGSESLPIKFDKLESFLNENERKIKKYLGKSRTKMVMLITKYLSGLHKPDTFEQFDELQRLVRAYRDSAASHMVVEGLSPSKVFPKRKIKMITFPENKTPPDKSFSRRIRENEISHLDLEIRQSFPCIDGCIYTLQEILVAKTTRKTDKEDVGFEFFLRQFIIKKLEDAFISQEKYYYPHVPRPFGSYKQSHFYEWSLGTELCPDYLINVNQPSDKEYGLYDWFEFVNYFAEAGIDMKTKLTLVERCGQKFVKQIIVKQKNLIGNKDTRYISRLWQRVNFHEESVHIDFNKLLNYLIINARWLKRHIRKDRYDTVVLAVKYLSNDIKINELPLLKDGIKNYRASTLRHINYQGFEPSRTFFDNLK